MTGPRAKRPATDLSTKAAKSAAAAELFAVTGRVSSSDRAGVGGLRVDILDKNVGADVLVAQALTDGSGAYSAQYAAAVFLRRGKTAPDIQARVFAGDTLVVASDVRYNAGPAEVINLVVPAGSAPSLPTEHETLTAALAVHFKGNLRDLKESPEQQDVTFLANKSGWDARAVALAALADQFSHATSPGGRRIAATAGAEATDTRSEGTSSATVDLVAIQPALYYALFRAGFPANPDALYHSDLHTVVNVWKQAITDGVIPPAMEKEIPRAARAFQQLTADKLLSIPSPAGISAFKDLLATRLNETQQQQFASLYAAHRTDPAAFWDAVTQAFGKPTADRLQVDGKLALLTRNNAPLMQRLQHTTGQDGLADPVQLAYAGFHEPAKWQELLDADVAIPPEIPDGPPEVRRANYAEFLAAQVRLSYPTAALTSMVRGGTLKVRAPEQVHNFLVQNQGRFEISMQPVQQYIARNQLQVPDETVSEIRRIQRVYQMTHSDASLAGMINNGMDAAFHIVRMDRQLFIDKFAGSVGGEDDAARVYDKAVQIHNAVLNVSVSYLAARGGVQLGAAPLAGQNGNAGAMRKVDDSGGQILRPQPSGPTADNASDIIAYPTLEKLFGSMDFCACDHCRSVLSPAAYLVDLLQFVDRVPTEAGKENPQTVLLERRPDLQHLPLTCENTNTALPYIDVVNETLEYYIANSVHPLSLKDYTGHDTDGAASEDLLASPQFVMDSAYTVLRGERFPSQLPFHQPLENLRRYFDKFEIPLTLAMERLRKSDDLERGTNPYGWRDILGEELQLSRDEYDMLTNGALTLQQIYGFSPAKSAADIANELSNAKAFSRRAEITYDDVVSLLGTRFINPNSELLPKLAKLGVPISTLVALHDGTITDAAFDALLPQGAAALDPAEYGGDVKAWVKNNDNFARIMSLITLTNPTAGPDPCDFDQLEFRHAKPITGPADTSTRLSDVEFVRILRFIRVWKKTGWTIEQTDAALCALYRADLQPVTETDLDTVAKLDNGFLTLLPRLGIMLRIMEALNLTVKRDLLPLLACWSPIGTHGSDALYGQMFLNAAVLQRDPDFADNGFGEFLVNNAKHVLDHAETLRGAFNLTGDEFDRIVAALGFDNNTSLTLQNISAIYRRGWLAHKLRLSVRELLLFIALTGLDPFAAPDSPTAADPAFLRLISLVQNMKARGLKSAAGLYLIWNQDLSGKSAPKPDDIIQFARTLRGDFAAIDDQFAAAEDPGGDIARARMSLVYGQETPDSFFSLIDNTVTYDTAYTQAQASLDPAITAADSTLAYDAFRHRLSHTGVLSATTQAALKAVAGVTADFQSAVDALFARSEDILGSFFARFPELKPLYDAYFASVDPVNVKRSKLLAAFSPELARRRKQQQALERLSSAAAVERTTTEALMNAAAQPYPLHAIGHADQPALKDILRVETQGLAVDVFFRNTATGAVDLALAAVGNLDYGTANPLPANPIPGATVSGIWRGSLETPEAGFYNIVITADTGANVALSVGGVNQALVRNGKTWRNNDPLELKAGTLYDLVLKVEDVKTVLSVKWETPKRAREVIGGRYLYPPSILGPFHDVYLRFLKVTSLASTLLLTANEFTRFGTDADYQISGDGWLNKLPAAGDPSPADAAALLPPLEALLEFARIKADVSPSDEQLLTVIQDPAAATTNADSLMFALLRWDRTSLNDLLTHFGKTIPDLSHFDLFRTVYNAFGIVQAMGIPAAALIKATTNDPNGATVRDLQSALRARYSAASWRDIVQPINDDMRSLQRDALVAYILHQMRENPATAQIDTPDKLFEYFLMDVQMEPCMQTSRIRHALSSAQLFIERCLMNLEPRVSSASIDGKQWEWMKRYRVWEANRKVFLWPENWLEPELRDDKSPFFKELESELLQSDITDDAAVTATLNYLGKLEEVAKLEPCGFYYQPPDTAKHLSEMNHVIARTQGAHRKYYYRRFEFGYWTPWDQVKLDIEDNPIAPYVWNSRLLLFWLKILKKTPQTGQRPTGVNNNTPLTSLTMGNLPPDPSVTYQAVLCWSEYYNGKWQAMKTSDVDRPEDLVTTSATAFDRSTLTLNFFEEGDALRIRIIGPGYGSFLLYNTHSVPLREEEAPSATTSTLYDGRQRWFEGDYSHLFGFEYLDGNTDLNRDVLAPDLPYNFVKARYKLPDPWNGPIFYNDNRHVFYVTTTQKPVFIRNYGGYGIDLNSKFLEVKVPPLVLIPDVKVPVRPKLLGDGGPVGPDPMALDVGAVRRFVTEDAYIRQGLGITGNVQFGDQQIGPAGSIPSVRNAR